MAFDWEIEEDQGAVTHLDKVFTEGHAPKLAGMIQSLERFDMFFYHADVLTGQNVGSVSGDSLTVDDGGFAEAVVNSIECARVGDSYQVWSEVSKIFDRNNGRLWDSWTDNAGQAAREKFERLQQWYGAGDDEGPRQPGLYRLAELTVQYAATIHAARNNLNSLMGDAVERAIARNNSSSPGNQSLTWVVISQIAGLTNPATAPAKATINFVNALDTIVTKAKGSLPGDDAETCYGILSTYLRKADDLLEEVSGKIRDLVSELRDVRAHMLEVPQWES